jgi:glutamine synthetase
MTSVQDLSTRSLGQLSAACREVIDARDLELVVVAGVDASGVLRGKRMAAEPFAADPAAAVPLSDLVLVLDVRGEVVTRPKHFDGWWPSGETTGHADVLLVPDLTTFRALPWSEGTAIVLGEFRNLDGTPVACSPQAVLQRVLARASELGLSPRMAAELEFFVLRETAGDGYCSVGPEEDQLLLRSLNSHLRGLGLETLSCNIEGGPGQYEITIRHNRLPDAAHEATLLKHAIKQVARIHNTRATFMSKPAEGLFGSGCHLHQSLLSAETNSNLFFDLGSPGDLSETGSAYIAGQLATLADFTCIWAPTPNSYKRLLPYVGGSVSWAFGNRAASLRVALPDAERARIEHRTPGAEANVYLAMAAALAGGLHGIEAGLKAPEPSGGGFYEEPDVELIPMTLSEAIARFEASDVARDYLGEEFVRFYAGTRRWEIAQELAHVTDWELDRYSDAL